MPPVRVWICSQHVRSTPRIVMDSGHWSIFVSGYPLAALQRGQRHPTNESTWILLRAISFSTLFVSDLENLIVLHFLKCLEDQVSPYLLWSRFAHTVTNYVRGHKQECSSPWTPTKASQAQRTPFIAWDVADNMTIIVRLGKQSWLGTHCECHWISLNSCS